VSNRSRMLRRRAREKRKCLTWSSASEIGGSYNSLVVYAHPGLLRQNPEAGQSSTQYAMRLISRMVRTVGHMRHGLTLQHRALFDTKWSYGWWVV
jgi:hypothetical protein